jgi:hypothetical protein
MSREANTKPRQPRAKNWTPEQDALARKMVAANESEEAFLTKIGRTKNASKDRIKRVNHGERLNGSGAIRGGTCAVRGPSEEALADARMRAAEPRTLTAWQFKDPPLMQSALWKKMNGAAR